MKFEINIPWRDYQRDTITSILNSDKGTIHTIKSPRQCGKSTLLEALLLLVTINNRNACSIFVEPTIKQARKVFRELRKAVEGTPICSTANESSLDITFTNGSQILFISGESDISSLQGYVVKGGGMLFIDEAAFINDDVVFALTPTTDVHKAKIIFASTPRYRTGLFYEYFINSQHQSNIYSYDWSGFTLLTDDKLEFYKLTLPDHLFRNYYLGEFTDFGSGVFGNLSNCISSSYDEHSNCVFGIDWSTGSGNDETSITIFNHKKQMVHIDSFNDLDETQTIDKIVQLTSIFKPTKIQVELNSIGKIFFGLLQKRLKSSGIETNLIGFNTTNESKNKLVNKFQLAIQSNDVTILNNEKLIYQMNVFESKPTSTGKVTYAASKNNHDDLVMSTLLAYDCLQSGSYSIL